MNEQTIFTAALARKNPAERQAFLNEACGNDTALRAQVDELLAAGEGAGSFLEHPPAGLDATVDASLTKKDTVDNELSGALPLLEPCDKPNRIGKLGLYEIIEVVGQGGMGSVLRAVDTKLSRIVAVKVMAPELAANPTAVKRFLREAQSAAAVVHDHVVTIHAVDDQSRPPYLVMEFIEGQTLQQKIDREGALPLKQVLRIGSQMAAGLAAAHKTGLIHRDVKPANILLENGVQRVKITDFGLARAADDVEMTKTGLIAGTPQYMSPEQAHGQPIDCRSDLFSLGSVLYTMCTGRSPFRSETTMGTLRRVCEDAPRPISEVNAEIPEWLSATIDKLLAKRPEDRFQTAAEVADLLSQYLAHLQQPATMPLPPTPSPPVAPAPLVVAPFKDAGHTASRSSLGVGIVLVIGLLVLALPFLACVVPMAVWFLYSGTSLQKVNEPLTSSYGRSLDSASVTFPANEFENGWTSLYNGKDLTGWKIIPSGKRDWRVEDGILVGSNKSADPPYGSHLVTAREDWENFHLRAELRINSAGDSGILFRCLKETVQANSPKGYEAHIYLGMQQNPQTGSLQDLSGNIETGTSGHLPANTWFTYEIIARDSHITLKVNGEKTADWNDPQVKSSAGPIVLQLPDDRTHVEFRKIEIKELPSSSSATGILPFLAVAPFDAKQAKVHQEDFAKRLGVDVEFTNSLGMKLRLIPPGEFLMGQTQEETDRLVQSLEQGGADEFSKFVARFSSPQHKVRITQPFYFGACEVTVGQYRKFIDETKHVGSMEQLGVKRFKWTSSAAEPNPEERAVIGVSWDDAKAFCNWLSKKEGVPYDLPSEAQWEYACRAGTTTAWSFGDEAAGLAEHAIFGRTSFWPAEVVGSKAPNPFGLYDMHGNADEWCLDWHQRDFYAHSPIDNPVCLTDPKDKAAGRVARGGTAVSAPWWTRSTTRAYDFPATPKYPKGFRVAIVGDLAKVSKQFSSRNRLPTVIARSSRVFKGKMTEGGDENIFAVAFAPNDDLVATGHFGGEVTVWNWKTGEQLKSISGHTKAVCSIAFGPGGKLMATGSEDSTIRLWNTETWEEVGLLSGHTGWINFLSFLKQGESLASVGWDYKNGTDNSVRLWDVAKRSEQAKFVEALGHNTHAVLSPDETLLAVANGAAGRVRLWDLAQGSIVHDFTGHPTQPISVAFSRDGTRVAAGYLGSEPHDGEWNEAENAVVRMWDTKSGKPIQEFRGHSGPVIGVEFSPDDRWLLSTANDRHDATGTFVRSSDRTIRVWEVATGRETTRIELNSRLNVARWTPDGTAICSGVRLWDPAIPTMELGTTKSQSIRVRSLDPAKDKPISAEYTDAGPEGWLFTTIEWKGFRLLELPEPDLENCQLIGRFRMKSAEAAKAYPRLIARFPGDTAKDTIGMHNIAALGDTNWTTYEVKLDLGPGERPEVIEFGLHMEGRGATSGDKPLKNQVWIKDVELLKSPRTVAD